MSKYQKFVSSIEDAPVGRKDDAFFDYCREQLKTIPADKCLKMPMSNLEGRSKNYLMTLRKKLKAYSGFSRTNPLHFYEGRQVHHDMV